MTLSALGIFSAAGAGGGLFDGPAYELIETVSLASSQSEVSFTNISQYASIYRHLQVRMVGRTIRAAVSAGLRAQVNGNTGSNYSEHSTLAFIAPSQNYIFTGGNAPNTFMALHEIPGTSIPADKFAAGVLDITEAFSSTKNKTLRNFGGWLHDLDSNTLYQNSGAFYSTAVVDSLRFFLSTSDFASGTRFSLYGIRG
jgi:hypothetical protein